MKVPKLKQRELGHEFWKLILNNVTTAHITTGRHLVIK